MERQSDRYYCIASRDKFIYIIVLYPDTGNVYPYFIEKQNERYQCIESQGYSYDFIILKDMVYIIIF